MHLLPAPGLHCAILLHFTVSVGDTGQPETMAARTAGPVQSCTAQLCWREHSVYRPLGSERNEPVSLYLPNH